MIRFARDFRLIPIVLLATVSLFALKVSGLVFDGGYTLADRLKNRAKPQVEVTTAENVPAYPKITIAEGSAVPDAMARAAAPRSWAQDMFNYGNDGNKGDVTGSTNRDDITGSSGGGKKKEEPAAGGHGAPAAPAAPPLKTSDKPPEPTKLDVGGEPQPLAPQGKINSPGERAILGRLQDRRQELDDRNRELDMRESLLKAAEKRLDAKVNELKDIEARIKVASNARDEAEVQRFKGIVSMYENMKPKDAARIFDRLDMRILAEVATSIKSRTMSEILAQMSPDSAEKLTVELANRANAQAKPASAGELPKIDGRPRD